MYLTKELFVIPNGEKFILYAPLKGAIAEVGGKTVQLLKRLKTGRDIGGLETQLEPLRKVGIVTDGETPIESYIPRQGYNPTAVTLIPTLNCNLKCVYCYSNAGGEVGGVMDIEVARSALNFVIENASNYYNSLGSGQHSEIRKIGLVFHGGGEPFLPGNMDLVKDAVKYFKDRAALFNLVPDVVATTNGFMNHSTLEWVVKNFDDLNISLDGPRDIQNRQRPTKLGGSSFDQVMNTIRYLENLKFSYTLRATITKESVSRMPEIAEFFSSISSKNHFKMEPLFECGRCKTTKTEAPDPKDFIRYMVEAKKVAEVSGRTINYSGSILDGIYDCFCSSLDKGFFCVLPDGTATSCLEVCREDDPRAEIFIIGKYDKSTKKFVFYQDRIQRLRTRNVDNIHSCKECFAKYQCAGECPSKCYMQTGDIFDPSANGRCEMTQGLIKDALLEKLKGGDKK
jgi:uncharacterized protein